MNATHMTRLARAALLVATIGGTAEARQAQSHDSTKVDPRARVVPHDTSVFGPDARYTDIAYDFQAQMDIYGAKRMNRTQRPLLELGRELYQSGPLRGGLGFPFGKHNGLTPQLLVYGDFRSAGGQSDVGGPTEVAVWSNRLNLDVDLRLTATERIHALFRPLENGGKFTGMDFKADSNGFQSNFDSRPSALFFEGDLGAILGGLSGRGAPFDMAVSVGLMPLVFHNGIWIEDAFTGGAFTIPARNSAALGWSNFDVTFFYGMDRLSNPLVGNEKTDDKPMIAGINTFVEANKGYWEAGYAYASSTSDTGRVLHSAALSFTRRYGGRISNSVRYIGSFVQEVKAPTSGVAPDLNGHLILVENSLISRNPTTFVPYLNLFYGIGSPVSAARDPGAGGILKNTGLNFETDALTAFPALDATGMDAAGAALGWNILGSKLNSQLVFELAGAVPTQKRPEMPGAQYAVGLRGQKVLTNAMLLRVDGMFGKRAELTDIRGVRLELRYKF